MKIWNGYGSEHSMNLVMIGHFKTAEEAEKTEKLIEQLTEGLRDKIDVGTSPNRFSDAVMDLLRKVNVYDLSPSELEHFLYDTRTCVDGDKIIVTTDESEVSAFLKLMVMKGARVEVYSAHDYPDTDYGRGK
ncbi:MAG: DUF6375 family protein [Thermodesulfovibrionales bacterium]|jgi:hypothetical protein